MNLLVIRKTCPARRVKPFIADGELASHHGTFVRVMFGDVVVLAYLEELCVKQKRSTTRLVSELQRIP